MTVRMWEDMANCFKQAANDENVRSLVFSGKGHIFTAGILYIFVTETFLVFLLLALKL